MERRQKATRTEMRLAPVIDPEKCTGCKMCIKFCKSRVLAVDKASGKVRVKKPDNCQTVCRICAGVCTAGAITFPDEAAFINYLRKRLENMQVVAPPVRRSWAG
jgi:NAD-dependent dihydropyrimidine dehydrogenase PreA subunit